MLTHKILLASACLCLFMLGCTAKHIAKPLDSDVVTAKILAKDPSSTAFKHYLVTRGYTQENLPITNWGLDELTLCALFYHTQLDIAKKQLSLASLAIKTAALRTKPAINAGIAHSNQKNDDIKPWSYGLSVDIPIATNNKRSIKIEKAQKNIVAAQMDVAEIAWQLRNQIAIDLTRYHQNRAETKLLQQELNMQTDIAQLLEKRVDVGISARKELNNINLLALKTEYQLVIKRAQFNAIKEKLAADIGISAEKFKPITIKPIMIDKTLALHENALRPPLASKNLQKEALLNRIDIRRSIARYEAAESEIKLRVAQQTPDITISPGILFDFGDSIWSLGFSSLLNALNNNTTLIEEAMLLREIQGAEFEHLQAGIIAKLSQARARYDTARQTAKHAGVQQAKQLTQTQKMQKQFDAGLIGKVELKKLTLNSITAKQQLLTAKYALLKIANQIENIMQKPLYNTFKMPELNDK